jgi:quercetin dioxygenase-like cupin family protein
MNTKLTLMAVTALIAANSAQAGARQDGAPTDLVLASEVTWEQLNPARGDKSPKAGTLWGDRNGTGPTGFLVQFADGFSSPPHIHPITYRAVVISGNIHNDDPDAAEMWMPAGSFWTQPKGEVHITAAKGSNNIALVEIDKAPYLVRSFKEAFDSGERPINVDASNIVWVDPTGILPASGGTKIAYLWGSLQDGQSNGTFVKLPAGFSGTIDSQGSTFRAVVIKGQLQYQMPGETDAKTLEPGSYFGSQVASVHRVSSAGGEESIIYVHTDGKYDVIPAQ